MADLTLYERVILHTKCNPHDDLVPSLAHEIGRLQNCLQLISIADQGCGGTMSPVEIWRSVQRQALEALSEPNTHSEEDQFTHRPSPFSSKPKRH